MSKTSNAHFIIFKTECLKWIDIFGLKGWEFHFAHSEIDEGDVAQCVQNCVSRIVKISLCKTWPSGSMVELTDAGVRLAAFDEVCHTFLRPVMSCASARFIMEHEIDEAEHGIIRTLQNVLYPKY